MAGDWIKMRKDLFTHPKVVRISSALKADTLRTVGGLMSVWCLFDAHSVDGRMEGYSLQFIDDHLRWEGFAQAMVDVGWLEQDGQVLVLPRFDTHNGASAKRRAQDADRKRAVRKTSASEADKMRTREEESTEELSIPRTSYSVSNSDKGSSKGLKNKTTTLSTVVRGEAREVASQVWEAYSVAYSNRYGVEPVRNAKVNGQIAQFCKRVPSDEAPAIASFYLRHNGMAYVRSKHAVGLLLQDAEGLRTEWASGRAVTHSEASQADKSQSTVNVFTKLIEEAKAREAQA